MIIELLGASFLVIGFLILFRILNLMEQAREAMSLSRLSLFEISRRDIDDDEKEQNLRRHSLSLLKAIAGLMLGTSMAAGLPVVILWGLDILDLLSLEAIMIMASAWPFLLTATVITLIYFWIVFRKQNRQSHKAPSFENRYSGSTRLLHNLAFASVPAQLVLADLEDKLYLKQTNPESADHPVLITSLPRAGTTLLLELCYATGEFATHSYRYMPFVFTPLFWQRLTRSMQTTGEAQERAHGDGMLVHEDSPEAFEEMLWMAHWEKPYHKHHINLWNTGDKDDFLRFFRHHMRKVVNLHNRQTQAPASRYISKNNLNIARIDWLLKHIPTAKIVVPFRHPLNHADSLLRQHLRFLSIHEHDAFARHYMAGIGHFDFGANLRPVNFDDWLRQEDLPPASDINFWLAYWACAYRYLLGKAHPNIVFVDYDGLCQDPEKRLSQLAAFLELEHPDRLIQQQGRLEVKPQRTDFSTTTAKQAYLNDAFAIYEQLKSRSLISAEEAKTAN